MKAKPYLPGELVLAIDFDGTITTAPDMGSALELQPNAYRVLHRMHDAGIILCLWTCRSGPALEQAVKFLKDCDLSIFTTVNEQLPEVEERYAPNIARKMGADFYIDDKNLGFIVDWSRIEELIFGEVIE